MESLNKGHIRIRFTVSYREDVFLIEIKINQMVHFLLLFIEWLSLFSESPIYIKGSMHTLDSSTLINDLNIAKIVNL